MLPHPISVINSYCTLYSTCKEHVILNTLDLRAWCISVAPTELPVTLFGGCVALTQEHRSIRHLLFVVELVYILGFIDRKVDQFKKKNFYM